MRLAAVALVIVLLVPAVGALTLAPPAETSPAAIAVGAPHPDAAMTDGELVRKIAATMGIELAPPSVVAVPTSVNVAGLVMRLAERGGGEVAPEDAARFLELDPRVAAPTLQLLVAVDRAWTLRDEAYARLTIDEQRELHAAYLALADGTPLDASSTALANDVDPKPLLEAAVLLLDTVELAVLPALQSAAASGAFPDTPIADPAGVLRIGSDGNDIDDKDHAILIEPAGNDVHKGRVGGTSVLNDLSPSTVDSPVSVALELAGDDRYDTNLVHKLTEAYGGTVLGIAILYEVGGADSVVCASYCAGGSGNGVAILRDWTGGDERTAGAFALGSGGTLGILRDGGGDDHATVGSGAAGFGNGIPRAGRGLYWDTAGRDEYSTQRWGEGLAFGTGTAGGYGWFLDEGTDADIYSTMNASMLELRHGCNACTWQVGLGEPINAIGIDEVGNIGDILLGP